MKSIIFLFPGLILSFSVQAQEEVSVFPEDFLGVYLGTLHILSPPKAPQEIPMEFHLTETDSSHIFNYILIYDGQARNYSLVIKDKAQGLFEVDEHNGILLESRFSQNTLFSFFQVGTSFLSSRLAFSERQLDFELLFSNVEGKSPTGFTMAQDIFSYPISIVQKARLERIKAE